MDLSHRQWKELHYLVRQGLLLGFILSLVACASSPSSSVDTSIVVNEPKTPIVKNYEPKIEPLPLNSELVYYILMAEIAGQRGEIGIAADLYDKAANGIHSTTLAKRSTQVANFTRNQKLITRALDRWMAVDPTNADIYIMQAPLLMINGDHSAVVKVIDTALDLTPTKSRMYLAQIADNLSVLTTSKQALAIIKQLKLHQNKDPEVLFVYARLASFFKQYDDALPAVEAVLEQQAEREDALILKAEILQRLAKGENALAILKKAAQKETTSDDLLFSYAKLLAENNKTIEARAIFEQLNSEHLQNKEILFALGLLELKEKNGHAAKSYFSRLVTLGDQSKQASYFMGLAEELNGNIEAALIWFASVPTDSSRFLMAQNHYINLLADNDQLNKARLYLKLLRKENPKQAVQYFLLEATFLQERAQTSTAFNLYNEALRVYPNHVELLYGRAMVAESLNHLDILESDLKQILVDEPNNAPALNALGYTLADRTNRLQEALALIKRAVALSPEDPFYLDSLGWVHYRLGNLDYAERYLKHAVSIQNDPEFLAHLGEVLWQQNKQKQAKRVWQQGLQQTPNNKLLNKTMRRFGQ